MRKQEGSSLSSCDRQSRRTRRQCSSRTAAQPRNGRHSLLGVAELAASGALVPARSERLDPAGCEWAAGARVLSRYSTTVRAPSAAIALASDSDEAESDEPVAVQKREITTLSQLTHTL